MFNSPEDVWESVHAAAGTGAGWIAACKSVLLSQQHFCSLVRLVMYSEPRCGLEEDATPAKYVQAAGPAVCGTANTGLSPQRDCGASYVLSDC